MRPEETQRPASSDPQRTSSVPRTLEAEADRFITSLASMGSDEAPEARLGSGVTRVPAPETLAFASHVHEYHREYIAAADQKAGFVFAVSSALLVYLYQQSLHLRWIKAPSSWSAGDLFTFVAMSALLLGLAAAASVVVPRLSTSHRGFIFFLSVAEYENASEYAASIARETGESLTLAMLRHIYDLAAIARRKYRALAVAIWSSVIGLGLSIIILLLARAA